MFPVYATGDALHNLETLWQKYIAEWQNSIDAMYKALYSEYNPLNNYDMTENESIGRKIDKTVTTPTGTTTQSYKSTTFDDTNLRIIHPYDDDIDLKKSTFVVFDLETTGLDLVNDRIIQISYIKVMPSGEEKRENIFVNPGKPIPPLVQQLTGITDADVADAPTFKSMAASLATKFKGCDFAGFNSNHFDIPMLAEEFLRAGIDFDFSSCRLIDAQTIFHKMERRNLAAAYKFYCGRKMEDDFEAHRADQDTEATYRVLMGELDKYSAENQTEPERQLANDMDVLAEFSKNNDNVDFAGRIVWKEVTGPDGKPVMGADGKPLRQEVFNFGKHKGLPVADVLKRDPGYFSWMLGGDFTYNTKQVLTRIRLREFNNRNGLK